MTTYALDPALAALHFAAALLLACSVCTPVFAQTAVDLQQQGYVAAFHDPRVLRAIQSGATQAIAVTIVQWTGLALQIRVLP